jgi:pyridoxine/pyridoxamine 5'-phosphate oxidase
MAPVIATEVGGHGLVPMGLIRIWYQGAVAAQVENPSLLALATAGSNGHASNRVVRILEFRDDGLVFTTHAGSLKGRQLAETGWSSGVMYWPSIGQQVIVSGPTHPLDDEDSDKFWEGRPLGTNAMSAVSKQSAPLYVEEELRRRAAALNERKQPLPRPDAFKAYLIRPTVVELWRADKGHLHYRLKYNLTHSGWQSQQLQP